MSCVDKMMKWKVIFTKGLMSEWILTKLWNSWKSPFPIFEAYHESFDLFTLRFLGEIRYVDWELCYFEEKGSRLTIREWTRWRNLSSFRYRSACEFLKITVFLLYSRKRLFELRRFLHSSSVSLRNQWREQLRISFKRL